MKNMSDHPTTLRRLLAAAFMCVTLVLAGCGDDELEGRVDDLENRVASLETLCDEMNTNISSLQTLLAAIQDGDYVTGVTPVTEGSLTIGYTITFARHQPITLYHGKDGATPQLSVALHTDGLYYWRLNGEWLTDSSGDMIPASGKDGTPGTPGATPQFKIENGRWLISWNNGSSWTDIGQATGDPGQPGEPGVTPLFKIGDGRWLVSYDGGLSWTDAGQATGDSGTSAIIPLFKIENNRWLISYDGGSTWTDAGQATGDPGTPGQPGTPGTPGTTPLFKIENDLWYVSYDSGASWQSQGQATGDPGQPGTPGEPGITPQLKIEDGRWFVSTDNGLSWNDVGQATGDSFFKSIDNSADDHVDFIFADGTTITVPKSLAFTITFSNPVPRIAPGETIETTYTLSQGDDATLVKTVTSNGWKAEVIKKDNLTGTIRITAPTPITDDEVLVFISDGKGKTVMSAISFIILIVENVPYNTIQVSGGGGDLNIEVTANLPVSASSPDSWIQPVQDPQSRTLTINLFRFTVQPNKNDYNRTGTIEIKNTDGSLLQILTITQGSTLDEILAREREILTIFYYSTNGDQWLRKDNWLSDKSLNEWYGINVDLNGVRGIDLGANKLSGTLPPEIGELTNLQELRISNYGTQMEDGAQLTGSIPPEIGKLQKLEQLMLAGNKLSGNIPEEIKNLANLWNLDLSSNQLSGSIPSCIGELPALTQLNLSSNQLTGSIPPEIGKLTKLTHLNLSGNRLTGSIPREMGNMTALQVFLINGGYTIGAGGGSLPGSDSGDLISNQISGEIPVEFARLPNLTKFEAYLNRLSGEIPEEIWKPSLYSLLLNGNQLTGSLPPAIRNAQNLMQLWLGNNLLTGQLPDELCELPNLEELLIGNFDSMDGVICQEFNHFEGPIPENIGNLKKLRQFYACNNNIEGTIPAGLADLPQLSELLLLGNRLQGLVPQELINSPQWSSWNPDVNILPQQPGYFLFTDEHISTDFSADGEIYTLQTATQGDGVDIVLIGDGFADVDIADGTYETTMRQAMENFFAREPVASFRDRFNVYVINAVSTNRGIGGNTALNCRYGSDTFISGDDNRCMDYASKIPDVDLARTLVIVILNDTKYAGTTNMYSNNFAIAYCPIVDGLSSDRFVGIILHEAVGHGFAKLADEYVYPEMGAIPQELVEQYSAQKLNGWWANADFTADPAAVSWASFISDPRYEAEGVSVYEGALTYTEGAYRPTLTSLMDQNVGDFNAPSRESIYKRVMELSGESYSRDKFLDYDAVNRTSAAVAARAAAARAIAGRRFTPLHPPVLKEFNR